MRELLKAAVSPAGQRPSPWVLADSFSDPGDGDVFGAAYAVQMVAGEPWLVRGVLRRAKARAPALVRVAVEHLTDPARDVTGTVIRDINFGTIRDDALAHLQRRGVTIRALVDAGWEISAERVAEIQAASAEATNAPPKRREDAIKYYRLIAFRYLELVAEGRRDVLKALAEEKGVKRETVRGWLRKATTLKMLGPGKPGRAGREPGSNLYRKEKR